MQARSGLLLSLFPGLGLLDLGFIEQGWTVVRGPDVIYGSSDIHEFHPPAGVFEGVIGGPPWQARHWRQGLVDENLIPEFARCVAEAQPAWFLMENVPGAPDPDVPGYAVHSFLLNNRWVVNATSQNRLRRFWFGVRGWEAVDLRRWIEYAALEPGGENAVLTSERLPGRSLVRKSLRLQGLPEDFLDGAPLTVEGKQQLIGNGVPLPMSRAVARAIWQFRHAEAISVLTSLSLETYENHHAC